MIVHQPRSRHPRTDSTALLLSTTTELFVIDLIAQHNPETNTQLACHRYARFPQPLLHQFAAIETSQLRIAACGVSAGLIPQKAQQRITLFADSAEQSPSPAGTFLRNQPYVAGQRLAIRELQRILDQGPMLSGRLDPLARIGLARAYGLQGDTAKAKAAYQDFLTLWIDADPDIPILQQAMAEYAKLE
jgi:hypothetical protein